MKFAIKKEFFIKHRFWLLLVLVVPFTAVGIVTLVTTVGAEIVDIKKKALEKLAQIQKKFSPDELKNQPMIDKISQDALDLQKRESKVWEDAYKAQEKIYKWPAEIEKEFNFSTGLFAWEIRQDTSKTQLAELPPDDPKQNLIHGKVVNNTNNILELTDRTNKKHKFFRTGKIKILKNGQPVPGGFYTIKAGEVLGVLYEKGKFIGDPLTEAEQKVFALNYKKQIHPIIAQVQPLNDKGEGVVQLPGWVYTEKEDPPAKNRFIQYMPKEWNLGVDISEEAWIAQEDLWIQDEIYRLIRQANDYVSIFEGKGGEAQNTNYTFKNPYWELTLNWSGANILEVTIKNLLNRRQKLEFDFLIRMNNNTSFPPEKIQIPGLPLEPRDTPKGAPKDSRTVQIKLPPGVQRTGIYKVEQVLNWETAAVRRIDNICFGPLGEGIPQAHRIFPEPLRAYKDEKKAGDPNLPPGIGEVAQPILKGPTAHGLIRERYMEVTKQLRRMPVAVSLIVEQEHVDRVQTSFNNSRLRFLTNQVLLNRYAKSVRPQDDPQKGIPAQPVGGGGSSVSDELETNVELVIYGVITLYEKYPERVYNPGPTSGIPGGPVAELPKGP
jgi:hypothetical protein